MYETFSDSLNDLSPETDYINMLNLFMKKWQRGMVKPKEILLEIRNFRSHSGAK